MVRPRAGAGSNPDRSLRPTVHTCIPFVYRFIPRVGRESEGGFGELKKESAENLVLSALFICSFR